MDSAEREAIASKILEHSKADETEVLILDQDAALTRFTHNAIHQNVASRNVKVQVRAVSGRRVGVAATNHLDESSLGSLAERALTLASFAPRDEALAPLPDAAAYAPAAGAFASSTAEATPQLRARVAADMFAVMEKHAQWSAGFVRTTRGSVTVLNSHGVQASFEGTDCALSIKANAASSSGYAEYFGIDASALDGTSVATIAAKKAASSADPQAVEPGDWTVILEPAAFGELFSYITEHFSAQAFEEGSSFLCDGLDRPYLGDQVTVRDDYAHRLVAGMPFDYEGTPTERLTLVDRGVAKNLVTDSYWAAKLKRPNTGHALPAPNTYGPQPMNIVVDPGTKSIEQLIAETKRGLLITRFWYIRTVDQRKTIVTGMTRDGLFLIENGKLTRGVRNMRFNQSIIDALKRCELGNELHRTGGYSYSSAVPAAKLERFTFSSGTDF